MILKLLAVFSMALDHIGLVYFPQVAEFRHIGRLAFPIFAFLVAQGVVYTSDVKRYALRLLVLALISQPIYAAALNPAVLNVCFTLFLGVIACFAVRDRRPYVLLLAFALSIFCDYGYAGVGFVLGSYMLLQARYAVGLALIVWSVAFLNPPQYLPYVVLSLSIIWLAHMMAIPSRQTPLMRYGFYAFYPAHMALFILI